jgi:PAS domain S-box-containing protein
METVSESQEQLLSRIADLELRLEEAEETVRAIRSGEVDALVVTGDNGDQIFTLKGADHPYRVLVQEMREGTVNLDTGGAILYSNQQFARMLNLPLERVLGSNMEMLIAPGDRPLFAALLENAGRGNSRGELGLLGKGGAVVPAYLSLSSVCVSDLQTISVVITDLTEQKRNAAILASEQLSRSILEQAADAIVVFDAEGEILRASQIAHRIAAMNVIRKEFDKAFPLFLSSDTTGGPEPEVDAKRLPARELLARCRESQTVQSLEATLRRADGEEFQLLVSAAPVWNEAQQSLGCVVTLIDITDRKRAENELTRQAEELARSNADLQKFAYMTSHDLQEPLRNIASYAQLLEKRYGAQFGPDADDYVGFIVDGVHRMKIMIEALLTYSRVVNAETVPASVFRMDGAIHWARMNLQTMIDEARAMVFHEEMPMVRADQVQIVQLLQNLISNAIKYRSAEPPIVHISAQRKGPDWVFAVRDNGAGIPAQYHEQIFGVFKRLHGKDVPGTGIGLAICYRIAQRHGGRIWVESEAGKGSTFYFTLPAETGS